MAVFTLYLDETGSFRSLRGPLGVRVVGGVLLRGAPSDHEQPLRAALRLALAWWPGDWHACEVGSTFRIAQALQRVAAGALPPELRELRSQVDGLSYERINGLRSSAPRLLAALRAESARLLERVDATLRDDVAGRWAPCTIVLCAEHDLESEANRAPRYPRMLEAVVERTAWSFLEHDPVDSIELHVVAAEGGACSAAVPASLHQTIATSYENARALWEKHAPSPPVLQIPPVRFAPADAGVPGLVLADFAIYRLQGGSTPNMSVSPQAALAWSGPAIAGTRPIGAIPFAVCGVGDIPSLLRDVLRGARPASEAEASLSEMARRRSLPQGTLCATVQDALALIRRWKELGL
ncbi:MAG TPA: hypothetical protein PKN08_09805 [Opitutaceae bacterium]|nr:hypothetical protein [Opitutaceae bacterium]